MSFLVGGFFPPFKETFARNKLDHLEQFFGGTNENYVKISPTIVLGIVTVRVARLFLKLREGSNFKNLL